MTSLIIILVVLIISGLIAFVGDNVGRYAGRRHYSVFGLRPRRTAVLITVIAGILIAAVTILFMIMFSENVRVALFKLEGLRKELFNTSKSIEEKEKELEDLRGKYDEKANAYNEQVNAYDKLSQILENTENKVNQLQSSKISLQNSIKGLKVKIEKSKTQELLISVNQTIFADLIDGRHKKESEIREEVELMLNKVKEFINRIYLSYGIEAHKWQVRVSQTQKQQIINDIKSSKSELIVLVVAAKNTLIGEDVDVIFKHIDNKLIFSKDEVIVSSILDGSKTQKKIIDDIRKVLIDVHNTALKKGMLADFEGSLGVVEYAELYKLANTIKRIGTQVKMDVTAEDNIYTSGPLKITFIVKG